MLGRALRTPSPLRRDLLIVAVAVATLGALLLLATTRGLAGADPRDAAAASASVVVESTSAATLVVTCPDGMVAEGGELLTEPADTLVAATAGISSPGTPEWAVRILNADVRPVTAIAVATCVPASHPTTPES
jgi:hypothetical protein